MNPLLRFKKGTPLFLMIFMLGCFGFLPKVQELVRVPNSLVPGYSVRFIEQLFGLTPDGGSGFVEIVIVALPSLLISLIWIFKSSIRACRKGENIERLSERRSPNVALKFGTAYDSTNTLGCKS